MRQIHKRLYELVMSAHNEVIRSLILVPRDDDLKELVDQVYALRETAKLLDDARKEVEKLQQMTEKVACLRWAMTDGDAVSTEYCSGTPDMKKTVQTPKRGTSEYDAFCKHFGVPPDSPFKPHWPTLLEQITADMKAGKPLPPGCDPSRTWDVFTVPVRRKRSILGDEVVTEEPENPF